jgi:2-succinyl-5-enolpyruvyl-6-hydroxy-3-cyclohexene-1-carboxylate synthase
MPVRDADSFMFSSEKNIAVGCNRGASGIDGVIASACGFAAGYRRPVTLIIGDLAMLHDMNSLKIVSESEYPVRVIIINNNGGGIFHFLPIAGFENVFEEFFAAPINLNFEKPAEMFDLDYFVPSSVTEFRKAFEGLQKSNKSGIIEVKIDRNENFAEHCQILSLLHQDLNGVLDW